MATTELPIVARLLLPGRLSDGAPVSWAETATVTGWPEPVDGYTDWARLVELRPGVDPASLPVAAAGSLDPDTGERLVASLDTLEPMWSWSREAEWSEQTQIAITSASVAREPLAHMVDNWMFGEIGRFSGRAWIEGTVIEAPAYADSLLITTSPANIDSLRRHGLEVHEVSRARHIPIRRD